MTTRTTATSPTWRSCQKLASKADRVAIQRYIEPLQEAHSCITYARLIQGEASAFGGSGLRINRWTSLRRRDGVDLRFSLLHVYTVSQGHVSTTDYYYDLEIGNEGIQFHWHPGPGVAYPHVNFRRVGPRSHLADKHVPTGRTSIESVVRFLIAELGAVPLREDWAAVRDRNETEFVARASWLARPPSSHPGPNTAST